MNYERIILSGIPVLRADDGTIFAWQPESSKPLRLGTTNPAGELALDDDWRERASVPLAEWRAGQHARSRAQLRIPTGVPTGGVGGAGAPVCDD